MPQNQSKLPTPVKRGLSGLVALAVASTIWLPVVHLFYQHDAAHFHAEAGLSLKARALAARHLQLWTEPELKRRELQRMRASNAEWDFMGRSFLVWSLANMCLREPASRGAYLAVMDQIIEETLKLEAEKGFRFFMMPYAKSSPYKAQPARSLFVDGEIALMIGARRVIEEKPEYRPLQTERVNLMVERLKSSPILAAESYPDECWTFDHVVALDAIRTADVLDGSDHSGLFNDWIAVAKQKLVHRESGLLVSSYTLAGKPMDGPEGSTIWMVAHCLQLIDEAFARDQYETARKDLGRIWLGFGFAREWPASWNGPMDVDSGPVIPVLGISAGSSGMAFIGATTFSDTEFLQALATTLDFAAFPSQTGDRLKYCASNQVGDAAMLYAAVQGPLWKHLKKRMK